MKPRCLCWLTVLSLTLAVPLAGAQPAAPGAAGSEATSAASAAPASSAPAQTAPGAPPTSAEAPPASPATEPAAAPLSDEVAEFKVAPSGKAFDLLPATAPKDGGLTAAAAAKRAIDVGHTTHIAAAEAANAERRADRAISLFVPRLDLHARYTRLSEVSPPTQAELEQAGFVQSQGMGTMGSFDFGAFVGPLDAYSFGAALRVPVSEYFLSLHDHYESAQKLEVVGRLRYAAERDAVAFAARRDYYQLALTIAARQLAEHRVAQLERFTEEIRALVEGGELSSVELAQAQTRLSGARASYARAVADERSAAEALRKRLDFESGVPIGVAEPLTAKRPVPPTDLAALQQKALRERKEVQALLALIEAHEHTRDGVAGARYPTLSLFGNVDVANPNQRYFPLREEFNTSWAVGVELAWSPTDIAVRENELDDSELELLRAREDLRGLAARIDVEVTAAYEDALAAAGAVETAASAVQAAQEALDAHLALFRAGESTSRQVLDAELDLRAAQLQWVTQMINTHLAKAALEHATGH